MPHLTLEYSKNLGPEPKLNQLLGELHQMVGTADAVDIETLKSRMLGYDAYYIGAAASKRAFLHVRLEVLPGRTEAWKRELGIRAHSLISARAQEWLGETVNCSTTFEITELSEPYFRTAPPKK